MVIFWTSFIIGFIVILSYLVIRDRLNTKICRNIVEVKHQLMAKADRGDVFASLFRFFDFTSDNNLKIAYPFLKKFDFEDRLEIGPSIENFWKRYEEEEQKFKQDPKYKLYRLYILNVHEKGCLEEHDGFLDFTIEKHMPGGYNWVRSSSSLSIPIGYYGYYAGGSGGGGGSYKYSYVDDRDIGKLLCPAFEKIKELWKNTEDRYSNFTFVIKDDEVDDFCTLCEFVCGESLSW